MEPPTQLPLLGSASSQHNDDSSGPRVLVTNGRMIELLREEEKVITQHYTSLVKTISDFHKPYSDLRTQEENNLPLAGFWHYKSKVQRILALCSSFGWSNYTEHSRRTEDGVLQRRVSGPFLCVKSATLPCTAAAGVVFNKFVVPSALHQVACCACGAYFACTLLTCLVCGGVFCLLCTVEPNVEECLTAREIAPLDREYALRVDAIGQLIGTLEPFAQNNPLRTKEFVKALEGVKLSHITRRRLFMEMSLTQAFQFQRLQGAIAFEDFGGRFLDEKAKMALEFLRKNLDEVNPDYISETLGGLSLLLLRDRLLWQQLVLKLSDTAIRDVRVSKALQVMNDQTVEEVRNENKSMVSFQVNQGKVNAKSVSLPLASLMGYEYFRGMFSHQRYPEATSRVVQVMLEEHEMTPFFHLTEYLRTKHLDLTDVAALLILANRFTITDCVEECHHYLVTTMSEEKFSLEFLENLFQHSASQQGRNEVIVQQAFSYLKGLGDSLGMRQLLVLAARFALEKFFVELEKTPQVVLALFTNHWLVEHYRAERPLLKKFIENIFAQLICKNSGTEYLELCVGNRELLTFVKMRYVSIPLRKLFFELKDYATDTKDDELHLMLNRSLDLRLRLTNFLPYWEYAKRKKDEAMKDRCKRFVISQIAPLIGGERLTALTDEQCEVFIRLISHAP